MGNDSQRPPQQGRGQQQRPQGTGPRPQPQQQVAQRQQQEQSVAPAKSRYADELARVTREIEADKEVLAGLLKARPDSPEFGQFVNEVQLAINKAYKKNGDNPLLVASAASFRSSLREAAGFGYSLNPRMGECFLIPRSGEVELQHGYKGLNKLAWRSGILSALHSACVYKGEPYKHIGGTDNPRVEHEPDDLGDKRTNKWDDILCAYASAKVLGGTSSIYQVAVKWRLRLARGNGTTDAWKLHPDAMCRKTALLMLANEMPRSDKLREFHLAVAGELEREADPEFTVTIEDGSAEAGSAWLYAVEGWATLEITEPQLLQYLGIDSSADVTAEQLHGLETTFRRSRSGDLAALAEIEKMRAGPQLAESPAEDQPDAGPQPVA
jgi:phage RecT family recombinase